MAKNTDSASAIRVMGVLNVTPDSFSDGGLYNNPDFALKHIEKMVKEGASIIDVGGESTRPGSDPVKAEEEIRRIEPVIKAGVKRFPEIQFSIDTMKAEVAKAALSCGATMVNDVSGLRFDPEKAKLCAEYDANLVIMHSKEMPKTMQDNPQYDDVLQEVAGFLKTQCSFAKEQGVKKIYTDPGIGFGKTLDHNLKLLAGLEDIVELGYPVLVGVSRKSMIGKLLNDRPVDGRLAGTIALHYHAMMKGASIIRVHDVREAVDSVRILQALQKTT